MSDLGSTTRAATQRLRHGVRVAAWIIASGLVGRAEPAGGARPAAPPSVTPAEIGYSLSRWSVEDGLPTRVLTALAQTPDSHLWVGSHAGLIRFDGVNFRVFRSSGGETDHLENVLAHFLATDAEGRLWIGGLGALTVLADGRFRKFRKDDGFPEPSVNEDKFALAPNGGFWLKGSADGRFYHYRENRFEAVSYPGISGQMIDRFVAGPDGVGWGVHETDRTLIRFTDAGPEVQPLAAPDGSPEAALGRFFLMRDGTLAVNSKTGIYTHGGAASWKRHLEFEPPVEGGALDSVQDRHGHIWTSVFDLGLVHTDAAGRTARVRLRDSTDPEFVRALLADADGNVWVASDQGLFRLGRNAFRPLPQTLEVADRAPKAMAENAAGNMLIVYTNGLLRRADPGSVWEYTNLPRTEGGYASGVAAGDGSFYTTHYYERGKVGRVLVERVPPAGEPQRVGRISGLVRRMHVSRDGVLRIATTHGLWRLADSGFARTDPSGAQAEVSALSEDSQGRMVVAVFGAGLYRLEDGGWQQIVAAGEHPLARSIWAMHHDDEDTLWAATGEGLASWGSDGWVTYGPAGDFRSTIPSSQYGVTGDRLGGLWITSAWGVTRLERADLRAYIKTGKAIPASDWFDRGDGLPSIDVVQGADAIFRAGDGRIWVGTTQGAAVIDPAEWVGRRGQVRPPPVRIESVLLDDQGQSGEAGHAPLSPPTELTVPPGKHRLEIRYTAVNLTAHDKSRFRYRMEGVDDGWIDARDQRSAAYHQLPPGRYRFRVTAANKFGGWNEKDASIAVTVLPQWWQRTSVRIAAIVLLAAGIGFGVHLRTRALRRRARLQESFAHGLIEAQETERKRIAADLHDSLGQNLLAAKNQLYLVGQMGGDAEVQAKLEQIGESVGAAIEEARTISHQLRPVQLERLGLTRAIRSLAKQTGDSTNIPIDTHVEPVDGLFPDAAEITIYRIVQESLTNIVKHADASGIVLSAEADARQLRLVVGDDGRGFDVAASIGGAGYSRGLGLGGLQERTRLLGGRFLPASTRGEGTTLTFEIPIPRKD